MNIINLLIDYDILITYGAVAKKINKDELIYSEGQYPQFYFQVLEGEILEFSANNEGKILAYNIFTKGESFGEHSLFTNTKYICNTKAIKNSVIIKISKENLNNIRNDYAEVNTSFLHKFAERIYQHEYLRQIWVSHTPEEKIVLFFKFYKYKQSINQTCIIPFTRKIIAEFTGMRVETVIRTLSDMNKQKKVQIIKQKVYY